MQIQVSQLFQPGNVTMALELRAVQIQVGQLSQMISDMTQVNMYH
jgi:hypothetical protein